MNNANGPLGETGAEFEFVSRKNAIPCACAVAGMARMRVYMLRDTREERNLGPQHSEIGAERARLANQSIRLVSQLIWGIGRWDVDSETDFETRATLKGRRTDRW